MNQACLRPDIENWTMFQCCSFSNVQKCAAETAPKGVVLLLAGSFLLLRHSGSSVHQNLNLASYKSEVRAGVSNQFLT